MPKALEEITQDAVELPRHERMLLARILLQPDSLPDREEVEAVWDAEIRARLTAFEEGRVEAEPYEEVRSRMLRRFGR